MTPYQTARRKLLVAQIMLVVLRERVAFIKAGEASVESASAHSNRIKASLHALISQVDHETLTAFILEGYYITAEETAMGFVTHNQLTGGGHEGLDRILALADERAQKAAEEVAKEVV